ncbi:molybdopterin molybdotransferase [Serinibacter salmoneus]|uniref:Molybdopterin molybdenumtransferase n=2 Tax=Serinibacter salmoneus TaxID=556530 RepID=A0A2A9D2Y6_9MICO|nr:molybdopterin molybdotransferase [Serinibacter salmoneus]
MRSVADQRARVLDAVAPLPTTVLPLAEAHGLRLAQDMTAAIAVPTWDNSAMDGYAVRAGDIAAATHEHGITLRIVADLPAGSGDDPHLAPGEAARIMTGAVVPTAADAVVPLEQTDRDDPMAPLAETVTVYRAPGTGQHLRRAGEDLVAGDPVLAAGSLATGAALSALAATGHGTVRVHRRARVAVIATGSELVRPGEPLTRGLIPDSNSLLVAGLVREHGGEVVAVRHVDDDAAHLAEALRQVSQAPEPPDVVVLTGGVSEGAFDPVKQLFTGAGGVEFARVRMQPGKPQAFGRLGDAVLFGLPGNPVSAWVSFHVFVAPALAVMHGMPRERAAPPAVPGVAGADWGTPPGRDQYLPARISTRDDRVLVATPVAALGSKSHLVASLAQASGYAIVPAAVDHITRGDAVSIVRTSLETP